MTHNAETVRAYLHSQADSIQTQKLIDSFEAIDKKYPELEGNFDLIRRASYEGATQYLFGITSLQAMEEHLLNLKVSMEEAEEPSIYLPLYGLIEAKVFGMVTVKNLT